MNPVLKTRIESKLIATALAMAIQEFNATKNPKEEDILNYLETDPNFVKLFVQRFEDLLKISAEVALDSLNKSNN